VVNRDASSDSGPAGLDYSPDGQKFVTARVGKEPIVWDANTGQQILTFSGHTARVLTVDWSPDGTMLPSASADGTVGVWDVMSGERLLSLVGHTNPVRSVAFSPDGRFVVSGSGDQTAVHNSQNHGCVGAIPTVAKGSAGSLFCIGIFERLIGWHLPPTHPYFAKSQVKSLTGVACKTACSSASSLNVSCDNCIDSTETLNRGLSNGQGCTVMCPSRQITS